MGINYINLCAPFVIATTSGLNSVKRKIRGKRLSGYCQVNRMNKEEIKSMYSMRDILEKCGLPTPNRAGFCHCPFHKGDREPSMKIYDKDFNCFGCGANGDIFTFIEKFYGISFKEAFLELGGEYKKKSILFFIPGYIQGEKRKSCKRKAGRKETIKTKACIRPDRHIQGFCAKVRTTFRCMVRLL